LRISRDLHDLLGHALTAIALKGEVAGSLLADGDVENARREVESIASVAEQAIVDVHAVAFDERPITMAEEVRAAAGLLASVRVHAKLAVRAPNLDPAVDRLMGWAIREGVTNALRHSSMSECAITVEETSSDVRLEIDNDGASRPDPQALAAGTGLAGLHVRAAALAGTVAGRFDGGRFLLVVAVPK
jgi:two-component system, NarL family, sensor histidine kinase DesK